MKITNNVISFHQVIKKPIDEDEIYPRWHELDMQDEIDDLKTENKNIRQLHKLALLPVDIKSRAKSI